MMKRIYIYLTITTFLFNCTNGSAQSNYQNTLQSGFYTLNEIPNTYTRHLYLTDKLYYINPVIKIGINNIKDVKLDYNQFYEDQNTPELMIRLDSVGALKLEELTKAGIGTEIGFVLNDTLIYVATISGEISGGNMSMVNRNYNNNVIEGFIRTLQEYVKPDE